MKTIDSFLVRLDTLVLDIREYCLDHRCDPAEIFSLVLACDELADSLRSLSGYVDLVREHVLRDPRHATLRPFLDTLINKLNDLKPIGSLDETVHPSPDRIDVAIADSSEPRRWINARVDSVKSGSEQAYEIPVSIVKAIEVPIDERRESVKERVKRIITRVNRNTLSKFLKVIILISLIVAIGYLIFQDNSPKRAIVSGDFYIRVDDEYLVLGFNGRDIPYGWINGSKTYFLIPYYVVDDAAVVAKQVVISRSGSYAVFSIRDILNTMSSSSIDNVKFIVTTVGSYKYVECVFVNKTGSLMITSCSSGKFITFKSLLPERRDLSVLEALSDLVDERTIHYIRVNLLGDRVYGDIAEASWFILSWLHNNANYSDLSPILQSPLGWVFLREIDANASSLLLSHISRLGYTPNVLPPDVFLHLKRGVCIDYALFTATALLAAGVDEVYLVTFTTDSGVGHVAAGVVIDGVLYILDQKLPVVEWADYIEYIMSPSDRRIQVVRASLEPGGSLRIHAETVDATIFSRRYPDSYPSDLPPESFARDVVEAIRRRYNISSYPQCPRRLKITFDLDLWIYSRLYTPLFHRFLAEHLADEIVSSMNLENELSRSTCLWYDVQGTTITLYLPYY